ncbi:MAG: MBOAT family protein [Candidatus Peribacteraceae bacterium]|nr:MBOAT family protein [Candidatus Peribacteraceae bacterium]MDD5739941.1 MBOAT family protein [Candidatus Peribacteraceae bacterium]
MAFDSPQFLFGFLPAVLLVILVLQYTGKLRLATQVLIVASLVFYGWWKPATLLVLLGSVLFNYLCGLALIQKRNRALLAFAITGNVLLLGYFKYLNFFADTLRSLGAGHLPAVSVMLPLGISFFTFTQIAYLVDTYRGVTRERNLLNYVLFVTFFPNLLAGPITHHADLLPQFKTAPGRAISRNVAVGLTVLIIGLCKKVLLADTVGAYANLVFNAAASTSPSFADAWMGALAYSFQLYFDFSGYSDMAIGIAHMMGISLPMNFNAPYRSPSIREFWKRWHITLSRFLMTYLYIPLGGSRHGQARTLLNLFLTMLIGGLWHGAGWTFIVWGAWHGGFLVLHRIWLKTAEYPLLRVAAVPIRLCAVPLTFLMITVGWVFFRAENIATALTLLKSMAGLHGVAFSPEMSLLPSAFAWKRCLQLLAILSAIVWFAPTTQAFVKEILPADTPQEKTDPFTLRLRWKPTAFFALCSTVMALTAVTTLFLAQEHVFIYFQF